MLFAKIKSPPSTRQGEPIDVSGGLDQLSRNTRTDAPSGSVFGSQSEAKKRLVAFMRGFSVGTIVTFPDASVSSCVTKSGTPLPSVSCTMHLRFWLETIDAMFLAVLFLIPNDMPTARRASKGYGDFEPRRVIGWAGIATLLLTPVSSGAMRGFAPVGTGAAVAGAAVAGAAVAGALRAAVAGALRAAVAGFAGCLVIEMFLVRFQVST